MRYALHAEWTKLRTLRSNAWLLVAVVVCTVAASVAAVTTVDAAHCPTPSTCFEDLPRLSLTGVWFGQVAAVVLATGVMGGEYGTGLVQATLAAHPRRHEVLVGKALVVAATVLVAGAAGVLGALLAGRIALPANGFPPLPIADPATLRAAVGTVLYLALVALLALGVATAVRSTAGALATVLALLFVTPVLVGLVSDPTWNDRLERLTPTTAGLAIQATTGLERLPIAPWPGLGVLAAYAALALLTGGWLLSRRDLVGGPRS